MLILGKLNIILMDRAIIIFAVIGTLMFAAYMFFIIKTSYDDEKKKKQDKINQNGSHEN